MTLLQGVVNTFVVFIARIIAFALTAGKESYNTTTFHGISIVTEMVFGVFATLIVRWYSRYREFYADSGSAQFVGREKMIAALERLKELQRMVDTRQTSFATMKISDRPSMFSTLFSTHPPLSARIEALKGITRG
jgi:heat shock protein HtpX